MALNSYLRPSEVVHGDNTSTNQSSNSSLEDGELENNEENLSLNKNLPLHKEGLIPLHKNLPLHKENLEENLEKNLDENLALHEENVPLIKKEKLASSKKLRKRTKQSK
jgi:hypothetical protein